VRPADEQRKETIELIRCGLADRVGFRADAERWLSILSPPGAREETVSDCLKQVRVSR
jgi:hypothetical protein